MKCLSLFSLGLLFCLITSCNQPQSGALFNGKDTSNWNTSGNVSVQENALTLSGPDAMAILKQGNYKNFELSLEVKTDQGGKGAVCFHSDVTASKGYKVAINNDVTDPVWWKMSGSLLSVRNLTKSFVKENQWFAMKIKVEGKAVSVLIDGAPVVEYTEPVVPYRTEANANARLSEGLFALISTGSGNIQFRKIEVNVLKEAVDEQAQQAEATDEQNDEIIKLHQSDFPVLDYHVHLKGGLTKEMAAIQSRKTGINYAIAPNCGIGFPITNDQEIRAYLDTMRTQPFILAMQGEGREWVTTFSPEARAEFDYVFTDALTFTDKKGRRTRLWIPEEVWIENEEQYMDLIVEKICGVLEEPVDVYVNPNFLPASMADRYDQFWTEARMQKVIDALVKTGKALEINELYNIPNKAFILKAKEAGIKFTFGSNNITKDVSKLEYSIRMAKECGITAQDMYRPKIKI
ncbi:family 16 glycoside hydrolase [Macellibacteroides fermentans]|uniref:3-keto-alpha-glucoside-1,2-lyase/3-keto-2-hydroxy-glucal hydratase domain-containing protein n=1 Tax=bioreactor metagenome TaxID=1076179 RepID=A0A644VX47_9ZZZZ